MFAALALLVSAVPTAIAAPPAAVPLGYSVERDAGVRWTYPTSAASEVGALQHQEREIWARLSREFGTSIAKDVDIRIGLDPAQMQALAPDGQVLPSYASGVAFPDLGMIMLSFAAPGSWLRPDMQQLLAHELSHIALYRAVSGHEVPRWFAEGVAIHQSGEHSLARARTLWESSLGGELIALRELSSRFPAREGEVDLAYAEAADLVGHMLESDRDAARFRALITALGKGEPFERAFGVAYSMSLEQLEQRWRGQLVQRFGRWPSILSGLTLIWALGAVLLIVGYVRVRRRQHQTLKRWAVDEAPLVTLEALPQQPPPAPPPAPRSVADDVLDTWSEQRRRDSGVPTVVHDGRSHTLH